MVACFLHLDLLPSVIIQLHVKLLSLSYDLLRISMRLEGVVLIEPHLIGYSSFTGSAYFKGVATRPTTGPEKGGKGAVLDRLENTHQNQSKRKRPRKSVGVS